MPRPLETGRIRSEILVAVVLTAGVLAVGVFLGAMLFGKPTTPAPPPIEPASTPLPREPPVPTLRGATRPDDMDARLTAVEKAIEDVRASQAAAAEQVRPLLEAYDSLKRDGGLGPDGRPAGGIPMASERATTGDDARKIARALGLDATRREAMATQFAQTLADLEALEKTHAEVSRDGDVTTIKIGRYGDAASGVIQRWRDWIDRNLSPEERDAYEREHSESQLIGLRAGQFDRTIRIDEGGGVIRWQETIATKDGPMDVVEGTAPAEARDLVFDPYRHLLPQGHDR